MSNALFHMCTSVFCSVCYITLFGIHELVVDVLCIDVHDMLFVEFVYNFVCIMFVGEVLLLLFTFNRCQWSNQCDISGDVVPWSASDNTVCIVSYF